LATGFWNDIQEIEALRKAGKVFRPAMEKQEIEKLFNGWKKAVERARL
jgi:glycerol kinase